MILILSQSRHETTTERVMDWLESLGVDVVRLNGEDLDGDAGFTLEIENGKVRLGLAREAADLCLDEVRAVWYRRWQQERLFESVPLLVGGDGHESSRVAMEVTKHLSFELWKTSGSVFHQLRHVPWLSDPDYESPNKLTVLQRAAQVGLDTPATLVTTRRDEVRRFLAEKGPLVTKPIGEPTLFFFESHFFTMYTSEVTAEMVDELPPRFFPSLFQAKLEKEYELRVFFLDGECYPMAIFSQLDSQTQADFRCYNRRRPNRYVPYRLAAKLEKSIRELMGRLHLDTGSLDLVKTPDGRLVFLEVNPIGQFGMVSRPCNYRLERRVAEALVRRMEDASS